MHRFSPIRRERLQVVVLTAELQPVWQNGIDDNPSVVAGAVVAAADKGAYLDGAPVLQ